MAAAGPDRPAAARRRVASCTPAAAPRSTPPRPAAAPCRRSRRCSTRPRRDILVCVSHEGETALTLEAARAFGGDVWLVTGKPSTRRSPTLAAEVIVATPRGRALVVPHRELHVRRRRARRAARRATSPGCRARSRRRSREPPSAGLAGARADRRRGPRLADRAGGGAEAARRRVGRGARPSRPSSCCTATSPRSSRARARSCSRAKAAPPSAPPSSVRALEALGCETTLRPDAASRRRHRPLPPADARRGRGARRSTPIRSAARRARRWAEAAGSAYPG